MRPADSLPDRQTVGYMLLELIAISGELPADQLRRLSGGDSYKLNVVRVLKTKKLLNTYYRDRLRGYRLTTSAKKGLCLQNPDRFSFALTGSAETNLVKSEINKYEVVEGTCVAVVPKPLRKYRKIKIIDDNGNESTMLLNKQTKVKIGYRYRFYFKETNRFSLGSEYLDSATSTDCFLGFEELGEYIEMSK